MQLVRMEKKYTGTVDDNGQFEIHSVPVSDTEYNIFVEMRVI